MEVITLGHPVLHQVAQPVANCRSPEIQQLIDQLIALTAQCQGVGIAASQVGVPLQLMIVASHPTPRYPHAPTMTPTALINPQILRQSTTIVTDWEGCLSVPGQRGLIPRAESVTVAYTDRQGQRQTIEFTGFVARIFQHEYDHLQGKLFLDRVATADAVVSEADYQAMIAPVSAEFLVTCSEMLKISLGGDV
jgi:peptide deformylase